MEVSKTNPKYFGYSLKCHNQMFIWIANMILTHSVLILSCSIFIFKFKKLPWINKQGRK